MARFITDLIPDFLAYGHVFPCLPLSKLPATKQGWMNATNSLVKINQWRQHNAQFNWAVACGYSQLFVFDIDPEGLETWKQLTASNDRIKEAVDATLSVSSPRGGFHFYFKGEGPSTASKIARGIDTRGGVSRPDGKIASGGYVILPGSCLTNGRYEILNSAPILDLPDELKNLVRYSKVEDRVAADSSNFHSTANIQAAKDRLQHHIENGNVSVEGSGGHLMAYKVAASLIDHGIDTDTALSLMLEDWNRHCSPPWLPEELGTVVSNASKYAEHKNGEKAILKPEVVFKDAIENIKSKTKIKNTRKITFLSDYAANAADPSWLVKDLIPAQGSGLLYGATGSYKSFIALDIAASLAHGNASTWNITPEKHHILFLAGEGANAIAKKRWPAWKLARKETGTAEGFGFRDNVPPLNDRQAWIDLKEEIFDLNLKPRLIVIDTLARLLLGMDENSAKDATVVTSFLESLAREHDCFVLAVHHVGKDITKGARGSSAFLANVDAAFMIKKNSEGAELRIVKQKDADVSHAIKYFKMEKHGDSIVLEPTDDVPVERDERKKFKWASPEEITAMLAEHRVPIPTEYLASTIHSRYDVDKKRIIHKLENTKELNFLREGKIWRLPKIGDAI